jgi:hypothetical protein
MELLEIVANKVDEEKNQVKKENLLKRFSFLIKKMKKHITKDITLLKRCIYYILTVFESFI